MVLLCSFWLFSDRETLSRIYEFAYQVVKALCKIKRKNCAAFSVSHLKLSKTVNLL